MHGIEGIEEIFIHFSASFSAVERKGNEAKCCIYLRGNKAEA
jgi:hypothetical protein